jgi:L-ascorbate metabolism protein UlaG (beta-lactamase superfamily)
MGGTETNRSSRVIHGGSAAIDWVVISHDHYDSLDKQTIRNLYGREGGTETLFFVPSGLKTWFHRLGNRRVIEMDWWNRHKEGALSITAVPVQHGVKESPFSRNTTLWAGWVIHSDDFRFFFCGDTGYAPLFKEIGKKLGPFQLWRYPSEHTSRDGLCAIIMLVPKKPCRFIWT